MIKNSSNSEHEHSKDTPTKNKREVSVISKVFRFVVRFYIKILKYTVLAFIEIFKEILRFSTRKTSKKS